MKLIDILEKNLLQWKRKIFLLSLALGLEWGILVSSACFALFFRYPGDFLVYFFLPMIALSLGTMLVVMQVSKEARLHSHLIQWKLHASGYDILSMIESLPRPSLLADLIDSLKSNIQIDSPYLEEKMIDNLKDSNNLWNILKSLRGGKESWIFFLSKNPIYHLVQVFLCLILGMIALSFYQIEKQAIVVRWEIKHGKHSITRRPDYYEIFKETNPKALEDAEVVKRDDDEISPENQAVGKVRSKLHFKEIVHLNSDSPEYRILQTSLLKDFHTIPPPPKSTKEKVNALDSHYEANLMPAIRSEQK